MIGTLFFRAALLWLAFRPNPEREFNRMFHEAMHEASFDLVLREMVEEIEDALNE